MYSMLPVGGAMSTVERWHAHEGHEHDGLKKQGAARSGWRGRGGSAEGAALSGGMRNDCGNGTLPRFSSASGRSRYCDSWSTA